MKMTFQPKKRQRSKVHGFRARMSSARWIVEFPNVLTKAFMEHWDLDDPPKYWMGDDD